MLEKDEGRVSVDGAVAPRPERAEADSKELWRTNETAFALKLAAKVLDNASLDPDGDLSVLARQFQRVWERLWQVDANWLREMAKNVTLTADLTEARDDREYIWNCLNSATDQNAALVETLEWVADQILFAKPEPIYERVVADLKAARAALSPAAGEGK